MKTFRILTVCMYLVCLAAVQVSAANKVSVNGSASMMVAPDRMNWSLTLVNKNEELSGVAKKQSKDLKEVLGFLKKLGIADQDIQTDNAVFGENWERSEKEGYIATTTIVFCIYDFGKYESIWEGLSHIDGLKINGTTYEISDSEKYQSDMRKQAVLNAKEKAEELAEPLGAVVGRALDIKEGGARQGYTIAYSQPNFSSNQSGGEMFSLGMIQITSSVSIVFQLDG